MLISHDFASASVGRIPQTFLPSRHHVDLIHSKILGTPMPRGPEWIEPSEGIKRDQGICGCMGVFFTSPAIQTKLINILLFSQYISNSLYTEFRQQTKNN